MSKMVDLGVRDGFKRGKKAHDKGRRVPGNSSESW